MKKAKILISIIVECFIISYLILSFVDWNFNPGTWSRGDRVSCMVVAWLFSALLCSIMAMIWEQQKKQEKDDSEE